MKHKNLLSMTHLLYGIQIPELMDVLISNSIELK